MKFGEIQRLRSTSQTIRGCCEELFWFFKTLKSLLRKLMMHEKRSQLILYFLNSSNKWGFGNQLFKDAKVVSCKQILARANGGSMIAVPFRKHERGYSMGVGVMKGDDETNTAVSRYSMGGLRQSTSGVFPEHRISLAHETYRYQQQMHAGQSKKPLERYDPNSFRNRLILPTISMPHKNHSNIVLGQSLFHNDKRHFISTQQNLFGNPVKVATHNTGILSDKNKWQKYLQSK